MAAKINSVKLTQAQYLFMYPILTAAKGVKNPVQGKYINCVMGDLLTWLKANTENGYCSLNKKQCNHVANVAYKLTGIWFNPVQDFLGECFWGGK